MMLQTLLVASVVAACAAHVAWRLVLPASARSRIARKLLRAPLPEALARALRRQARALPGCGCEGCERAPQQAGKPSLQPVHWLPRKRG
jgi:hypothetical protein